MKRLILFLLFFLSVCPSYAGNPFVGLPVIERRDDIEPPNPPPVSSSQVQLDQNFQMDFSQVFLDVGRNIARNLTFTQGLMLSIFVIMWVWSVITGTGVKGRGKNKKARAAPKKLSYNERTDQLHRNIDKDLRRWGWSKGYSVNQIKRNKNLMIQYYNETYKS